jgi:U6 snRNA-associated Sm-like protein LSm6
MSEDKRQQETQDDQAVVKATGEEQESLGAPSLFLQKILGKPVQVRLSSGVDYRGVLSCLDGYMNIAMENCEELVDGQVKNSYGDTFIRGNNGKILLADRVHELTCSPLH